MDFYTALFETFKSLLPTIGTLTSAVIFLWAMNWLLLARRPELGNERKVPLQMVMLGLTLASIIAVVISLPIEESLRNQIVGLIGIVISGLIAFSSTNIIANLMAGVLLRITKPFKTGDFIRVGDFFGRVSERGLFDTEIQSETRDLIALPNSYLTNNAVSTVRSSGAIVSATLSLGYDTHHLKIEPLLIEAATKSGLTEPFVHIIELNDFSISYRISGLLSEVKGMITARSNLLRSVLDTLHESGIEIMSPSFMNQRKLEDNTLIIPRRQKSKIQIETTDAEGIVFDKAEKAHQIESEKGKLYEEVSVLEAQLKEASAEDKEQITEAITQLKEQIGAVKESHAALKAEDEKPSTAPDPNSDADTSNENGNGNGNGNGKNKGQSTP
jgi:small conductance mechanosensitive channel